MKEKEIWIKIRELYAAPDVDQVHLISGFGKFVTQKIQC